MLSFILFMKGRYIMIKFVEGRKGLKSEQTKYWKKIFDMNLLFASEIEMEYETGFNRNDLYRDLSPTDDMSFFGSGVHQVKGDGSLSNGAEITTTPRKITGFKPLLSQFGYIAEKVALHNPKIHQRASWHNHIILNTQGIRGNEFPIPDIIYNNIFAMFKLYLPALYYYTATLNNIDGHITRYNYFCKPDGLLRYDTNMTYKRNRENISGLTDKYQGVNVARVIYNDKGEIKNFHLELRFPDANVFPVHQATFQILIKSLIMKAVELSRFGLIDSTLSTELKTLYLFKNNDYNNERLSSYDTSKVLGCKRLMGELLELLEPTIMKEDEMVVPMVRYFLENPIFSMANLSIDEVNDKIWEECLEPNWREEDDGLIDLEKIILTERIKGQTEEEVIEKLSEKIAYETGLDTAIKELKTRGFKFKKGMGYYV